MHNPIDIAHYFIDKHGRGEHNITPMKLAKLVYIAHGWSWAILGKPLINETPEAWKYGPVIKSLYHHFKHFGGRPIHLDECPTTTITDPDVNALLEKVWEEYGTKYDALQLSTLTHQEGTPWSEIWHEVEEGARRDLKIPESLIAGYYSRLALKNMNQNKD